MNRPPSHATRPAARSGPGRIYAFLVIALATIVLGLTLGPPPLDPLAAAERPADALPPRQWPPQELLMLIGVSIVLGGLGAWLVGIGHRDEPQASAVEPQQVAGLTGLPVVGELFPVSPAPVPSRPFRWIVLPAELIVTAALLLSFHAAVMKPAIARQFVQSPFSAYQQSIQDWHAQIAALRER